MDQTHEFIVLLQSVANMFTDITLLCNGVKRKCHRIILCASSEYFRTLLTSPLNGDRRMIETDLSAIEVGSFSLAINFIYGHSIDINESNIEGLLNAGFYLQCSNLQSSCYEYIERLLTVQNCLIIRELINRFPLHEHDINGQLNEMYLRHFCELPDKADNFDTLFTYDDLIQMLDSENHRTSMPQDKLFEAALKFVECDYEHRQKYLYLIVAHPRWPQFDKDFIEFCENSSLIVRNGRAKWVVGKLRSQFDATPPRPRHQHTKECTAPGGWFGFEGSASNCKHMTFRKQKFEFVAELSFLNYAA